MSETPSPRQSEAWMSVIFAGLFLSLGVQMAFLQLWFADWGLTAGEIGAVNAFAVGVRIVSGVALPALSDQLGWPRASLAALALIGAAASLLHLLAEGQLALYALTAVLAAAYAGLIPLSDAHGYAAADRVGFSYRRARSVGSFAFLAATILGGVAIEAGGVDVAPIWMGVALLLVAVGAMGAPFPREETAAPPLWRGLTAFLTSPAFLVFLVAVAAVNASHAVYYVYGSLHWRGLGYSETLIGLLWAWGVLAEIALFLVGRSALDGLGATRALALAAVAAIVRWSVMALEPGLTATILLQTLHAATFALMHLAALAFIAEVTPRSLAATGQGLMSAAAGGLGMLPATLLAAWVFPVYGVGAYWLGAICGVIGLVAALMLTRMWSGGVLVAGGAPKARPMTGAAPLG